MLVRCLIYLLSFFLLIFYSKSANADFDNTKATNDFEINLSTKKDSSEKILKRELNRQARIAAFCSAIVPGLGQAVNKKWWKIPIIYAAGAGVGYFFIQNHTQYVLYRNEITFRVNNPNQSNNFPDYSLDNLVIIKNQYRKYRDLSTMGLGLIYVLNILDAYVDGHLKKFDVSENLSIHIKPHIFYTAQSPMYYSGIQVKFELH
jgi:hypothetical protein